MLGKVAGAVVGHMLGEVAGGVVDYTGRNDVDAMKSLKRSTERLRSRAMDIEDEVNKEKISCKKKMKTEVNNWVKEVNDLKPECDDLEAMVSNSSFPLIGDPVVKMQCRVNQLIEQGNHFNGLTLDDFDNHGVPCSPTKLFGNKIMETLKKIWPCLVVDNIASIGIYGMGGVGKTTLAKHIMFELKRENYSVYWVTVSQEFSVTTLQDKIANALGISLLIWDEEHVRANILRAAFEKMEKSVFILDDVWKEFHLEDVGIAIAPNKCCLILTTRSLLVCDRMLCQRKFMVPTLDKDESWGLFKHTLGYATMLSAEVEKIGKSVANRCAGLPLGIVTTAASMRGVTDIREWNIVLEQLKSPSDGGHQEMEDEVFPILEWSFNRLRGCEIPCFLYCCLYPEDYEIEREKLIDLFIYAELIPRRATLELERDGGHATLNKLVKVCLLQEAKNGRGDECVRMHDLLRDMALRITSERYNSKNTQGVPRFLVKSRIRQPNHLLVEKEEWKDDLTAVSLMMARSQDLSGHILEIPPLISPTSLSTLIINGANIGEIPDSFLEPMCGLKVLNLEGCDRLKLLPDCISEKVNLTALLLEGCSSLKSVPPLGKLKKLRTLNLRDTKVDDVPQGLEELVNLERLYIGDAATRAAARERVPASMLERDFARARGRACMHARALACMHAHARALALGRGTYRAHEILREAAREASRELTLAPKRALPEGTFSKLYRLQHLVLPAAVYISDLRVLNKLQFYVGGLTHDQFSKCGRWPAYYKILVVDPNESYGHYDDYILEIGDEVNSWRCFSGKNRMIFRSYNFQKGLDMAWPIENLHSLELDGCSGLSDGFCHRWIENLYQLRVQNLKELKFVLNLSSPDDDKGVASNLEGSPGTLRVIKLLHLPSLVGLINIGRVSVRPIIPPGIFSSLEKLFVYGCDKLKKLFSVRLAQQCLQNLQYLEVCHCNQLEEIVADDHDLNGGGGEAIISQPSSSRPIASPSLELLLPKLKHLILYLLPEFENVCSPTIKIGGDKPIRFELYGCPKLKRLPSFSCTKITYDIGGRKEWWNSLEWNNPSDKDAVKPFFQPKSPTTSGEEKNGGIR